MEARTPHRACPILVPQCEAATRKRTTIETWGRTTPEPTNQSDAQLDLEALALEVALIAPQSRKTPCPIHQPKTRTPDEVNPVLPRGADPQLAAHACRCCGARSSNCPSICPNPASLRQPSCSGPRSGRPGSPKPRHPSGIPSPRKPAFQLMVEQPESPTLCIICSANEIWSRPKLLGEEATLLRLGARQHGQRIKQRPKRSFDTTRHSPARRMSRLAAGFEGLQNQCRLHLGDLAGRGGVGLPTTGGGGGDQRMTTCRALI